MIVVDSAAVVDALTAADGTDDLRAALETEDLHAPALLDYEVVSALRGLTLGGHLSGSRAQDALSDFEELPLHRWACSGPLRLRAFSLRHTLTAYDAAYVALAEALECPLVTRDARLAGSSGHGVEIRLR
ncbi:MAG: type II toxin-antitoxin system VapC family toxin [Actinomycetes bacterium]